MDIDNEKNIAAVQKVQAIYDRTHKLYSNRQFLNQAWNDIGQELNIDGNVAKKKWTSLRDYFQRQHREMTLFLTSGSAPSKKKKWRLYDSMSFLVPYVTDRPASTNLSNINDDLDIETDSQCSTEVSVICTPTPEEEADTVSSFVETPPSTEMKCSSSSSSSSCKLISKRYPSNCACRKRSAQPDDIDREILNTLRQIPATPVPPQDEDADLLFFKSMIPHVKTLDILQKMELQAEMHSVLVKHMKRARANSTGPTIVEVKAHFSNYNELENQHEQC